ncbi:MAG: hypothetical protein MR682_01420 [Subdoligranulum variabile]|nr:hypothetical protein [Subdoligranulum variabile]
MSKPKLAEADMLRTDWARSHDLTLVAQLHACTPQDVIDALGLTEEEIPARYRHHTQPNGKHWGRAPWEEAHPEEAQRLYTLMDGGMSATEAAAIMGLSKGRTYAIYKRMKAKGTAMENKVESHKEKPSAKYEQGLMDLEDFITCFQPTSLLDADTLAQLDSPRKEARGFVLGMKFAEACHE